MIWVRPFGEKAARRWLAPVIAARITAGAHAKPDLSVIDQPAGCFMSKIYYCLGAANAIDSGDAFR